MKYFIKTIIFILGLIFLSCANKRTNSQPIFPTLKENNSDSLVRNLQTKAPDGVINFNNISILSIDKATDSSASFYNEYSNACINWKLDESNLLKIFNQSKLIDGYEFHNFFDELPCYYYGKLVIDNKYVAKYKVNSGATTILIFSDTTLLLGYYNKELFINGYSEVK